MLMWLFSCRAKMHVVLSSRAVPDETSLCALFHGGLYAEV